MVLFFYICYFINCTHSLWWDLDLHNELVVFFVGLHIVQLVIFVILFWLGSLLCATLLELCGIAQLHVLARGELVEGSLPSGGSS